MSGGKEKQSDCCINKLLQNPAVLKRTDIQYLWQSGLRSSLAGWFLFWVSCEGSVKLLARAAVFRRLDWGGRVTSKVPDAGGWDAGWAIGHRAQLLSTGLHEDPPARQAGWLHPQAKEEVRPFLT